VSGQPLESGLSKYQDFLSDRRFGDLTESANVEGYIPEEVLPDLITWAKLRSDFRPTNVRLHVTSFTPPGEGHMPIGVCAADLTESLDVRERSAGERMIGRLLERFKQVIAAKE
jgi:hypothetical protein